MTSLKAGGASLAKDRRPTAAQSPAKNIKAVCDSSAETARYHVSGSRHSVAAYALSFAGFAGFLFLIALTGLVAAHLYGIGGLAIGVGIFLVALMVAARAEGII